MTEGGILLHAKHAFMPNTLGYCGPDDRGLILQHLEEATGGEDLASTLKGFEAAYPFLTLIARSTGRDPFDYAVPEAYWIGNDLLDSVPVPDFHEFSHKELTGRDPDEVKASFKAMGTAARPHHTLYVMSTYASLSVKGGQSLGNDDANRVAKTIDNCRISWGEVKKVGAKELEVEYRPLVLNDSGLMSLARPVVKKVKYNRDVTPFAGVKEGDRVSLHWDYACELLSSRQVANIRRYTQADIGAANLILSSRPRRT